MTILALCALVAACGGPTGGPDGEAGAGEVLTASGLGQQTLLDTAGYLALPQYAGADLEQGRLQARVCRACHTLEEGGVHMLGPNLYGLFGRKAGSIEEFAYSNALSAAEFTWTPRALDAWLRAPTRFLPGNRMSFAGIKDAGRRDALIAYLLAETANDDIPVAE